MGLVGDASDEVAMVSPASFAMRFSPSNQLIALVRRFVMAFYGRVLGDNETSARLGLATHELLENAVKYGVDDEAELRVDVRVDGQALVILVALRNRGEAGHIARARRVIAALEEAKDPFAFYQSLMLEAADRRDGSGLGLARIRVETGMTLALVEHDGVVEISAEMRYQSGGAE